LLNRPRPTQGCRVNRKRRRCAIYEQFTYTAPPIRTVHRQCDATVSYLPAYSTLPNASSFRILSRKERGLNVHACVCVGFFYRYMLLYGHIQRMQETRKVKAIHSWKPISKRPTGRPKICWEDDVKKDT